MSGTDRHDSAPVGLGEAAAVRGVITAPDGVEYFIEKERVVLRKFDGDVCDDEHLAEVIVLEDGEVIDRWHRGEERDAPS